MTATEPIQRRYKFDLLVGNSHTILKLKLFSYQTNLTYIFKKVNNICKNTALFGGKKAKMRDIVLTLDRGYYLVSLVMSFSSYESVCRREARNLGHLSFRRCPTRAVSNSSLSSSFSPLALSRSQFSLSLSLCRCLAGNTGCATNSKPFIKRVKAESGEEIVREIERERERERKGSFSLAHEKRIRKPLPR